MLSSGDLTKPGLGAPGIKSTIFAHPEFTAFTTKARKLFTKWQTTSVPLLKGLAKDGHPKPLIETIAEDLLGTFKTAPLLDAYDVYQHLMDYWAETMQDDCYLIADTGWIAGARPREIVQVKNKEGKLIWPEKEDFKKVKRRFKSDLIPAALLIARYFTAEWDAIAALGAELASIEQQLDEMREEHSGEDGLLAAALDDKDKLTKASIKARLKAIPPGNAEPQLGVRKGKAAEPQLGAPRCAPSEDAEDRRRSSAGRAGPRLPDPHQPHPPARRTLRHPAAAAHR